MVTIKAGLLFYIMDAWIDSTTKLDCDNFNTNCITSLWNKKKTFKIFVTFLKVVVQIIQVNNYCNYELIEYIIQSIQIACRCSWLDLDNQLNSILKIKNRIIFRFMKGSIHKIWNQFFVVFKSIFELLIILFM